MPSKKQPPAPPWQVILEEIRSQNRSTIEAVDATRVTLEQRIDNLDQDTRSRDAVLEAAIRGLNQDTRSRDEALEAAVQVLSHETRSRDEALEAAIQDTRSRVSALEAAVQRLDQDSRSRDASLEGAIRDLKVSVQQNSLDVRELAGKVEALARLEERVSALEHRQA